MRSPFVSLADAGKIQVLDIMPEYSLYVLLGLRDLYVSLLYIFISSVYILRIYYIIIYIARSTIDI